MKGIRGCQFAVSATRGTTTGSVRRWRYGERKSWQRKKRIAEIQEELWRLEGRFESIEKACNVCEGPGLGTA